MAATGQEAVTISQLKQFADSQGGGFDINKVYPIGSVYLSMANTDPSTLFGGVWQKLEGRFLLTSDSSRSAGDTGGSNDAVAIEHTHSGTAASSGSHSHGGTALSDGSHTHSISGGSHSHSASSSTTGSHTHSWGQYLYRTYPTGSGWNTSERIAAISGGSTGGNGVTGSGGSHSHTITVSTSSSHSHTIGSSGSHTHTLDIDSDGSHTHSVTINSSGVDGTDKNMPAYLVVNAWQRTA